MSDEQIYMVLEDEFTKTENVLQDNLQELLTTRSSKALLNAEVLFLLCLLILSSWNFEI